MKANYGPVGGEIRLRWHDGVFTTGDANGVEEATTSTRHRHTEAVFLDLVATYSAQAVGATKGTIYAPFVLANDPKAKGISKRDLEEAMGRLLEAKLIQVTEVGPPSKRRRYLEVT
jgi:hypothetical protein